MHASVGLLRRYYKTTSSRRICLKSDPVPPLTAVLCLLADTLKLRAGILTS